MSLRRKITLLFAASLVLMGAIAWYTEHIGAQKNAALQHEAYMRDAALLLPLMLNARTQKLERTLRELGLERRALPSRYQTLYIRPLGYGEAALLETDEGMLLRLRYLDDTLILYDTAQERMKEERRITTLLVLADVALLVALYVLLLKTLAPLRRLSRLMRRFAEGETDVRASCKGNDEIAQSAQSFNEMAHKLTQTLEAKTRLLRDVGHELKTPLAKGKFALEKLPQSEAKTELTQSLADIERLVEMILHEKLIDDEVLRRERVRASSLLLQSLSHFPFNESDVEVDIKEDIAIEADAYYFDMALRNLVDNARKYATAMPVRLRVDSRGIAVCSRGEALDKPLEHYTCPFVRGSDKPGGAGLGLSIVKKIVDKHGFKLTYAYKEGWNCFRIEIYPELGSEATHSPNAPSSS